MTHVTVVPMFAPIIIGMALFREIISAPTIATTIDVVVDELCIMLVVTIPRINPMKGFDVARRRRSVKPAPESLKAVPRRSILIRNK